MVVSKKVLNQVSNSRMTPEIEIVGKDKPITPTEEKTSKLLSKNEEGLLLKLANNISEGQSCVCVGSGEAIIWLTKGVVTGQGEKIYFINPSGNDNIANSGKREFGTELFNAQTPEETKSININQFETSEEASRKCKEKIGLLWINKTDSYEDLKQTLLAWQPKLAPDAKIAFHRCDLPGPTRILKEYLGDQGDFTPSEFVTNTTVVSVDKCIHYWMIDSHEIGTCKYCGRKRNFKRIRSGVQGVGNVKKEDLQEQKMGMGQKSQPISKKKKSTKHRRAWNRY